MRESLIGSKQLRELVKFDGYLPPDQRQTVGLALGMRPWTMSWMTGLKKKRAAAGKAAVKK